MATTTTAIPNYEIFIGNLRQRLKTSHLFKMEFVRLLTCALIFIMVSLLMVAAQVISDFNYEGRLREQGKDGTEPLFDLGFLLLPNIHKSFFKAPDTFLSLFFFFTMLCNVVFAEEPPRALRYQGLIVLRRMLWIVTVLYALRLFTFSVTTIPPPYPECHHIQHQGEKEYLSIGAFFGFFFRVAIGNITNCTDNMFSGHTCVTMTYVWAFYLYNSRKWMRVIAYALGGMVLVSIVASHLHYTADVLVAIIISSLVFGCYHFLVILALDTRYYNSSQLAEVVVDLQEAATTTKSVDEPGDKTQSLLQHFANHEKKLLIRNKSRHFLFRLIVWMDGIDIRSKHEIIEGNIEARTKFKASNFIISSAKTASSPLAAAAATATIDDDIEMTARSVLIQ